MDYTVGLKIPVNTPAESPVEKELWVSSGTVKQVSIYFPWGCAGLVHVAIFHDETQLWPTTLEESYTGNDIYITFPEDYPLTKPKNRFVIRGWSPDTQHDHTPVIRLVVLPERTPAWVRRLFGRFAGR